MSGQSHFTWEPVDQKMVLTLGTYTEVMMYQIMTKLLTPLRSRLFPTIEDLGQDVPGDDRQ